MAVVTMVLVFLLAVIVSAVLARLLPVKLPLPLIQIAIGACLSLGGFDVTFDPHLFLFLFIPPLLFLDGWRIPKDALFRDLRTILALAIGLVVFTVVGLGFFIHWLIPVVPLAVAFALAAILSPTDPVAVGAMAATAPIPPRLNHILEGEALLNDATGLVCFSFAVTAALTGTFSLAQASVSFLGVAGGGAVVGVAVTWAIGRLNRFIVRVSGEEPSTQILISLLIPFAAYLLAEHLHVSGILAAAVAGIGAHFFELFGRALPLTRMQRVAVWSTVQAALNGIIFVLLGEQLPGMLRSVRATGAGHEGAGPLEVLGYAAALTAALLLLRFAWVWVAMRMTLFRARRRGEPDRVLPLRLVAVTATAGVRGAITLAGILTLPLLMDDGTAFPARDLAIVLAMGVILLSLLLATVALPLLTRGLAAAMPPEPLQDDEHRARVAASNASIQRLETLAAEAGPDAATTDLRREAAGRLLDMYRRRADAANRPGESLAEIRSLLRIERAMRREALEAAREEIFGLRQAREISDSVHGQLVREIDLMDASLAVADAD